MTPQPKKLTVIIHKLDRYGPVPGGPFFGEVFKVLVADTYPPIARRRDELFRFAKYLDYMLWLTTLGALVQLGIVLTTA